jgi:hypothetical protein
VEFLTPDLTARDLAAFLGELGKAWSWAGVNPERGPKGGPRWTDLDSTMMKVVERLGGVPKSPTRDWWQKVAEEWEASGQRRRSPDAHRKHWARLLEKLEAGMDQLDGGPIRVRHLRTPSQEPAASE